MAKITDLPTELHILVLCHVLWYRQGSIKLVCRLWNSLVTDVADIVHLRYVETPPGYTKTELRYSVYVSEYRYRSLKISLIPVSGRKSSNFPEDTQGSEVKYGKDDAIPRLHRYLTKATHDVIVDREHQCSSCVGPRNSGQLRIHSEWRPQSTPGNSRNHFPVERNEPLYLVDGGYVTNVSVVFHLSSDLHYGTVVHKRELCSRSGASEHPVTLGDFFDEVAAWAVQKLRRVPCPRCISMDYGGFNGLMGMLSIDESKNDATSGYGISA